VQQPDASHLPAPRFQHRDQSSPSNVVGASELGEDRDPEPSDGRRMRPGITKMTLRNRGEPQGFSRLFAPIMARAVRWANRKDLARLKAVLERR
jgi:hypothetical protein